MLIRYELNNTCCTYGQQWVKLCQMFGEKGMINLGIFLCTWCLLALKRLCESLLEMRAYFNNHLILCYFKVFYFCFLDGCSYARHKSALNITPSFPKGYRTWVTCFSIYYPLLSLIWTAAAFNHCTLFWFWQLYSATIICHSKKFLRVNIET